MPSNSLVIPPFKPIDFADIINNVPAVNTSGYFKEIMLSIDANIQKEFDENRLTGTDYATVYLGAMQYALDNVFKYVLAEAINNNQAALIWAQAKKTAEELELIKAQTAKVKAEISLLNVQYDKEMLEYETGKKVQQALIEKPYKENELIDGQTNQVKANTSLTKEKEHTERHQQGVLKQQAGLYNQQATGFKHKHALDVAKSLINANAVRNSSLDISDADTKYASWNDRDTPLQHAVNDVVTSSGIKWESSSISWDTSTRP